MSGVVARAAKAWRASPGSDVRTGKGEGVTQGLTSVQGAYRRSPSSPEPVFCRMIRHGPCRSLSILQRLPQVLRRHLGEEPQRLVGKGTVQGAQPEAEAAEDLRGCELGRKRMVRGVLWVLVMA